MSGDLGISASYEEWLEEFIMINSDQGRAASGSPLTRREYYAVYCGAGVDPKEVYRQHLVADEANRSRGAVTDTAYASSPKEQ